MPLILKIISPASIPPEQRPAYTFDELGGSIGRKPNNDFVLIDPERFISSQHATIDFRNGSFFITDTSTNGVFINHDKRPVGAGNTREITHGDKISIGEFQLEAVLENAAKQSMAERLNPVDLSLPPTSSEALNYSSPAQETFSDSITPANALGDLNSVDPLALLDGEMPANPERPHQPNSQDSPAQNAAFSPSTQIDAGITDVIAETTPAFFEDALSNPHQNIPEPSPLNEPFTPPAAIPDDWDIMGDEPLFSNTECESTSPMTATNQPMDQHATSPDLAFQNSQPESTTPLIPEDNHLFDDDDIFASLPPNSQPPQNNVEQPATRTTTQTAMQADHSSYNNRELLDAFIKGAGLDPAQIKTDQPTELLYKLGQLTRISTEGLMMALRARATIKSSFRVNKTIIAPVENNPLKFSVTSEDALNIIFAEEKAGYMPAIEAFSEGFKDLQNHQMAMMAGMQAIIQEITVRFDPATLTPQFEQQKPTGSSLIPGNKKARYWEMYEIFYKKMTENLQDDFQNVYGEEFARAYENQIRKLM